MSQHNLGSKNHIQSNNTSVKTNQTNSTQSYQTILASDIPLTFSESDLYGIFSRFGSVNKIQKLSNLSCCLIEFSDVNVSANLIQVSKRNSFYIGSHIIKLEYSSQVINAMESKTTDNSTNILSINISNVKYPITVDIIKQICLKFGKLHKIFIGKKNSENIVECLIEFEKISEAKAAKEALHGEDIYSGCCSLDVKYSKMSTVPVFKNDDESWDFTKSQVKQGILKSPPANGTTSALPNVANNNVNMFQASPPVYPIYNFPPPLYTQMSNTIPVSPIHPFPCRQPYDPNLLYSYSNIKKSSKTKVKLEINKDAFVVEVGVVFMVYNLPFSICVDHLFNLFCLYGNVHKIRFLPNQPGSAMIQMGSKSAAELCIQHYNNKIIFGQEMRLIKCSKAEIFISKNVEFLPNGTPSSKDFSSDSNNRFLNDHGINSNKILEPNRTLHFFNAPYTFAETDLVNMIIQSGVPRPLNIIIFNNKSDQIKKCIGLFEFLRLEDALIALSVLNHKPIIIPDTNQVFHMKLTFSAREPKNTIQNHTDHKRSSATRPMDDNNQGNWKKAKCDTKEIKDELKIDDEHKENDEHGEKGEDNAENIESGPDITRESCPPDTGTPTDFVQSNNDGPDEDVPITSRITPTMKLNNFGLVSNDNKDAYYELDKYSSATTPPLLDDFPIPESIIETG